MVAALGTGAAYAEEIRLSGGSTSINTIINPVKAAFEMKTGIKLNAVAAGSKVALQKLDAGEVDVATAAHSFDELLGVIKKDQIVLKTAPEQLKVVQLAEPTNYRIIVNPANSVAKLSKEQIAGIFSGKISNWKEVGGNDAPILCVVSTLSPGTNNLFQNTFLDGQKISVESLDATTASDLNQNVASNEGAIGFLTSALVIGGVKAVETPPMKSKPFILLTVGAPSPKVQKLVEFIQGEGKAYFK
jgi:phosphate transport system substrate-binding protein